MMWDFRGQAVRALVVVFVVILAAAAERLAAQQTRLDRLPSAALDVLPPSARVSGAPGAMSVRSLPCRSVPAGAVRQRIVDVAVQEWGFFGFTVLDQTEDEDEDEGGFAPRRRRGGRGGRQADGPRVATSIAGYWSVTPEGGWIVTNQNRAWNGPDGAFARWQYPWSAAFISWVMCEAGLSDARQFQRAIAHHAYIDQAIRAAGVTSAGTRAAFVARDPGETPVAPGDLLCTARRPEYRSLAERRRQMGQGARTHCDIVVKVDEPGLRLLAIGGNVRGSVSLKILAGRRMAGGLRPARATEIAGGRAIFAHLSLRTAPLQLEALDRSPTLRALGCASPAVTARRVVAPLLTADPLACGD